jgi:hypothetical protein
MRKLLLTLIVVCLSVLSIVGQNSLGFNYQAVIRNSSGEVVADKEVGIEISILQGSASGEVIYSEEFTPETNSFGLINLIIGRGDAKVGTFESINWATADFFIKIAVDINGGTSYVDMGTTQLLSVPFANYAFSSASGTTSWNDQEQSVTTSKKVGIGTETPTSMLEIVSDGKSDDETPLFEVKNSKGETVFAVYENSVKVFIDEVPEDGKTRGGFAVSGRTTSKETNEILVVTPEKTRVYVEETEDKTRGGFAVSGRTTSKLEDSLYFMVQPNLTQVFVSETNAKTRGGFAVSGRTTSKEGEADILRVTPGLTEIFVEETADAKTRGGFAVSGRTTSKEDGYYDIFKVIPERTDVFLKQNEKNIFPDGFTISALGNDFIPTELFTVSQAGTFINTDFSVVPKVATLDVIEIGQTYALAGGEILEYSGSTVWQAGVVYSTSQNPVIDWEAPISTNYGVVMAMEFMGGYGTFTAQLEYLNPGTTYYVKAFGINEEGLIGYGVQKSFVTDDPYMVTFEVYSMSEEPIINATISVFNNIVDPFKTNPIVNEPGDYIFYLAMGEYMYSVSAPDYYDYDMGFMIIEGPEHIESVFLEPSPNLVTFIVIDDNENTVPWITIYIEELNNPENFFMINTYENGVATVELAASIYNYWIEDYQGIYEYQEGQFEVLTGEDKTVYITLVSRPTYTVEITVYMPGMTEVSIGAEVSIFSEGTMSKNESGKYYSQLYSDANGKVVFTNVPEGSYELSAWHETDGSYWDYIWVQSDTFLDIELGWKKDENRENKPKPERKPKRQFKSEKAPKNL